MNRAEDFATEQGALSELLFVNQVLMFGETRGPGTQDNRLIAEVMDSMYHPGA